MFVGSLQKSWNVRGARHEPARAQPEGEGLPTSKRTREACLPVVNDFLLALRARFPNVDRHGPVLGNSQHHLRGPDEGGNEKNIRKEGQRSIPIRPWRPKAFMG